MFFFAYDGSINGDWVSHYAVQLAAAHPERRLTLLHVPDPALPEQQLDAKLVRLRDECSHQAVALEIQRLSAGVAPAAAIQAAVPAGPDQYLICGTPAGTEPRGLRGSTAEQLLRAGRCNVLAVRVVQPGLLGAPRRLLVPVSARAADMVSGLPFLRLFEPQLSHLHLVCVAQVGRRRLRRLSHDGLERLRRPGQDRCAHVERALGEQLGLGARIMDAQTLVSDQIHREILLAAGRTKSRLIYLGASERTLSERLLHGNPTERILRDANCDVAIYRESAGGRG